MRIISRQEYLKTPAGVDAKLELQHMVNSPAYDTSGSRDPQIGKELTFVERHLKYLIRHPYVSAAAYISNLRVMTKSGR